MLHNVRTVSCLTSWIRPTTTTTTATTTTTTTRESSTNLQKPKKIQIRQKNILQTALTIIWFLRAQFLSKIDEIWSGDSFLHSLAISFSL